MVSSYQQLAVAEQIRAIFGPFANPFEHWRKHRVLEFEDVKISQEAPIVLQGAEGRELAVARWGLVPPWFKGDEAAGRKFQGRTFNARSETVAEKSSFRDAWRKRRCLVPSLGFYEFEGAAGSKRRVRIHAASGEPLAFAGLWSRWTPSEGEPWLTFTILTTTPSAEVRPLHDRMPVVLAPEHWALWLDPKLDPRKEPRLAELLRPAADGLLVVGEWGGSRPQ